MYVTPYLRAQAEPCIEPVRPGCMRGAHVPSHLCRQPKVHLGALSVPGPRLPGVPVLDPDEVVGPKTLYVPGPGTCLLLAAASTACTNSANACQRPGLSAEKSC